MRNLIEYRFSCELLFFKYLKNQISTKELIDGLKAVEKRVIRDHIERTEVDLDMSIEEINECGLWFKFGKDDTLVTTISDIEREVGNLNHRDFRMEAFERVVGLNPDNELEIYFS